MRKMKNMRLVIYFYIYIVCTNFLIIHLSSYFVVSDYDDKYLQKLNVSMMIRRGEFRHIAMKMRGLTLNSRFESIVFAQGRNMS